MQVLFDQETLIENYGRRQRSEGLAEGMIAIAKGMLKAGEYTLKQIADITSLSMDQLFSLKPQM